MDPKEIQAALAWSRVPGVGERTLLALMDHAREGRRGLAALWEAPVDDLARIVRLHPRSVAALEECATEYWAQAGEDAAAIRARGVDLLLPAQPDYPPALREPAARRRPLVFAYGALALLEEPRAAIVTSRTVSSRGLAATDALADALARRDVPLVTSTSREAYQAAAVAAKRHAGPAVLALDRGIAEAFPSGLEREPVAPARVWDAAFDPDLQLLLSPFGWREPWSPRGGPRRDGLITDLADVIVALEVRPGGNMERECRAALHRGKRLLVLHGLEPEVDLLWDGEEGVIRLLWRGAEEAAEAVLRSLPRAPAAEERPREGRLREIGPFLARACAALWNGGRGGEATVGAHPAVGPLATVAGAWSARGGDASAGYSWLLADLTPGENASPARLGKLLDRVARGGLLAGVVPRAWLEDAAFREAREGWLSRASLRLAVGLPASAAGEDIGTAAVVLQRDGGGGQPARVFAPEQERMGRFHLRRYLQEVLASLS